MTQSHRYRADFPDGTVVFLIGMRFNRWWAIRHWLPVFTAMPAMLRELSAHPDAGQLQYRTWWSGRNLMVQQYWRSMDDLMRYATARDAAHFPAWQRYRKAAASSDAVGIWHEAYEVSPDRAHNVYSHMPPFGMGKATSWRSADEMPAPAIHRQPVSELFTARR